MINDDQLNGSSGREVKDSFGVLTDMRLFILALPLLFGCSGSDQPTPIVHANDCATPGASYLMHYVTLSGTCGQIPAEVVNIAKDRTVPQTETQSAIMCASSEQEGCKVNNSGCIQHTQHCTNTFTSTITFTEDGSSADGLYSVRVECDDGSSCSGTYQIWADRQ